jgi:hypothetical protein
VPGAPVELNLGNSNTMTNATGSTSFPKLRFSIPVLFSWALITNSSWIFSLGKTLILPDLFCKG